LFIFYFPSGTAWFRPQQGFVGSYEPLDIRASLLIAIEDMELTAKSPHLLDWFSQDGPAHIAELDLSGDGSDSLSCTGRTIPE
jgi:hypothetical protein